MADEAPILIDVLVIGSGPAGMSTAMHLSGSGLSVIVVERLHDEGFSRYHSICGEAVSERMFGRIGWKPSSIVAETDRIGISGPDGTGIEMPVKGYIVDRPGMLAEMRSLCDCEFVRGSVSGVSRVDGGFEARLLDGRILKSRWLVGADGAHSVARRDLFGSSPEGVLALANCIVQGNGGTILGFTVGSEYKGCYSWRFPSKSGTVSIGFPVGSGEAGEIEGIASWGARHLPFGVVEDPAKDGCILVGDAAGLPNPLCYGGIGAAMLSGRKAADAIIEGKIDGYTGWVKRDRMFDPRFMDAHRMFSEWTDDQIVDAMAPFRHGYSLPRGLYAVIRRPRWTRVYMGVYLSFRLGW